MKKTLLLFITSTMLLATSLDISGNITLRLNLDEKTYTKGSYQIEGISSICFVKGEGKATINKSLKLDKNSAISCYEIELKQKTSLRSMASSISKTAYSFFVDTGNNGRNSVSTRGTGSSIYIKDIVIPKNKDFYILKLNELNSSLVILKVLDDNGKIITQYRSLNKNKPSFIIKISLLKENYKLIVEDFDYDITYMESKVVFK